RAADAPPAPPRRARPGPRRPARGTRRSARRAARSRPRSPLDSPRPACSSLSMVRPPGRLALLERPPAAYAVLVQLEEPGHLVDAGARAVLLPAPDPPDQRQRPSRAALGVVLVDLLDLDRLLHAPGRTRRPQP